MIHRGDVVLFPPNRVWRPYFGGRTLDELEGASAAADSHLAEDWIASVTEARLPGRTVEREGISSAMVGGQSVDFKQLLESDPGYFLGLAHVAEFGARPMLLVKFLDSAIRLNFQVHPSQAFARQFLHSKSGKTEAYYFLKQRGSQPAYFYLGFNRPVSPAELRQMVIEQDIEAMGRCMHRVTVVPGEAFLIPGGTPHALGEGVFMVEIQEPTDLAVRLEFERSGYVLPEAARFLGRDVDFGLSMIDFTPKSPAQIERDHRCNPRPKTELAPGLWEEELIGPDRTPCFRVNRLRLSQPVVRPGGEFSVCIVTQGSLTVEGGGAAHPLRPFDRFCLPAQLGPVRLIPQPTAEILLCFPPMPPSEPTRLAAASAG